MNTDNPTEVQSRVLVISPSATTRHMIVRMLQSLGRHAEQAVSGVEAMDAFREAADCGNPFEAAIVDALLADIEAAAFAQAANADAADRATAIVLLTVDPAPWGEARLHEAGFVFVLPKPCTSDQVAASLAAAANATVPDPSRPSQDGRSRRPDSGGTPRQVRVLLAEDSIVNQLIAVRILERLGYAVDLAQNGREAVEALARTHYDLVLMDCEMPEMNGFEATAEIRQGRSHPDIAIVAMTASQMAGDADNCLRAGMDDYIRKPADPEALQAIIEKHLGREARGEIHRDLPRSGDSR